MLIRRARALCVCLVVGAAACRSAEPPPPNAELQAVVQTKPAAPLLPDHFSTPAIWRDIQRFYADNGFQLIWSDGRRPQSTMKAMLRSVRTAGDEGLDPSRYDVDGLAALHANFDSTRAAEVDVRFTATYLAYAMDLSRGRTRPEKINRAWQSARAPVDIVPLLETAVRRDRIEQSLKALSPAAPAYQALRTQLARHRALAAKDGESARALTGRIQLIQINMDRWRWMPDYLGDQYILVNIPAFRLEVIDRGNIALEMKVVTGRKEDQTPLLADQMTHVVFSPYWNIPTTIVKEEILPRLDRDPDYLARNNIEMMSEGDGPSGLRLRQRPGPGNSLGLVKFMFPNNFNVYLHDTPADKLFDRIERAFSHGCVRVERPADLAKYVLRDQPEWTEARIARAMNGRTEQTVRLQQPLPVYFAYFTAWDEHGILQTRSDIYGHDQSHLK